LIFLIVYEGDLESDKLLDFEEEIYQDLNNFKLKEEKDKLLVTNITGINRKLLFSITKKLLSSNYFAEIFFTEIGAINRIDLFLVLDNQAFEYLFTRQNYFTNNEKQNNKIFMFKGYYNNTVFQGIILDTRAVGLLIVGENQFKALQDILLLIKLEYSRVNKYLV
jgi:hypothetical protein